MTVSAVLSAVAALLWPLVVLVLLIILRGPIRRVLGSAEHREFTVKIGGQELTVGQLSKQQGELVADLQQQVTTLQDELAGLRGQLHRTEVGRGGAGSPAGTDDPWRQTGSYWAPEPWQGWGAAPDAAVPEDAVPGYAAPEDADQEDAVPEDADQEDGPWGRPMPPRRQAPFPLPDQRLPDQPPPQQTWPPQALPRPVTPAPADSPAPHGVLWVDDHPENNALLIQQLETNGVRVDLARSTSEALQRLAHASYQVIITDIGRTEDGRDVPDAGVRLVEGIRADDLSVPILVYSAPKAIERHRVRLLAAGARLAISSPTEFAGELRKQGLL